MLLVGEDHDYEKTRLLTIFSKFCPINSGYFRGCSAIIQGLFSDHPWDKNIHPKIEKPYFFIQGVVVLVLGVVVEKSETSKKERPTSGSAWRPFSDLFQEDFQTLPKIQFFVGFLHHHVENPIKNNAFLYI